MSPSAAPSIFADANVLFPASLRDILIYLALADVIELHWSSAVLDEMAEALVRTNRATTAGARSLVAAMMSALPEAEAVPRALPTSVNLPDPDDAHVLGAALAAECAVLLTFNLADFPPSQLAHCGPIQAIDPDCYLLALLAIDEKPIVDAVRKARRKLIKQPLTAAEHLDRLEIAGLRGLAGALRLRLDQLS